MSVFFGVLIADATITQHYNETHTASYYVKKCSEESGLILSPEAIADCEQLTARPQWWDVEDLVAQRQMAVWTRRIGYLTAFGLIALFWTLWETRRITAETRMIGEAQARAYLGFAFAKSEADEPCVETFMKVKNFGNSPAIDAYVKCTIATRRFGTKTFELGRSWVINSEAVKTAKQSIAPSCEYIFAIYGPDMTSDVIRARDEEQNLELVLDGEIIWTDVFENEICEPIKLISEMGADFAYNAQRDENAEEYEKGHNYIRLVPRMEK